MFLMRFRFKIMQDRIGQIRFEFDFYDLIVGHTINLSLFLALKMTIQIFQNGNGSTIPSGLPHQTFASLIGTCGTGSHPPCYEGISPLSIGGTSVKSGQSSLFPSLLWVVVSNCKCVRGVSSPPQATSLEHERCKGQMWREHSTMDT